MKTKSDADFRERGHLSDMVMWWHSHMTPNLRLITQAQRQEHVTRFQRGVLSGNNSGSTEQRRKGRLLGVGWLGEDVCGCSAVQPFKLSQWIMGGEG